MLMVLGEAKLGEGALEAGHTALSAMIQASRAEEGCIDYTYSVSFAVALCQGPITRIDRVWANGDLFNLRDVTWRLYHGTAEQMPDPLIEAIEGTGQAPAYRDTAYIVFEDLPLDAKT